MDVNPKITEIVDCLYRVSVKAVIIQDGKLLLVKDKRAFQWELPGGGVDYGEELEPALERELNEEIGVEKSEISIESDSQYIILGHIKEGLPRCNIHYAVHLEKNLTDSKIDFDVDIEEMKWVALEDIDSIEFDPAAGPKNKVISLINSLAA